MHYAPSTWLYETVTCAQEFEYLYDLDQAWRLSKKFAECVNKNMKQHWKCFWNLIQMYKKKKPNGT